MVRLRIISCVLVVAVLLLLHNDWLLPQRSGEPLFYDVNTAVFGWLPADMAYRLVWVALSCAGFYWVLRCTWGRR